uniref:Uncharacterized protein n=1 Tax=Zooxanthella nutricula TaxID=1333877 RepID=A0A7S2QF78_9DINO
MTMCLGLVVVEFTLNRFPVLTVLFPGMFAIRERRFYFFDVEVVDIAIGTKLRDNARMIVRATLCVVLSYLWQHCVLSTEQVVGTNFPENQCLDGQDCFASELHFLTVFKRQHEAVNCSSEEKPDFPSKMVVSCIKFVKPVASTWLMHLAIAHSVTQLNLKVFEILVWVAGNSTVVRRGIFVLMCISVVLVIALFFSGVLAEFNASWLSFVMTFSLPIFLHSVYRSGKVLQQVTREVSQKIAHQVEEHMEEALAGFDMQTGADDDLIVSGMSGVSPSSGRLAGPNVPLEPRASRSQLSQLALGARKAGSRVANALRGSKGQAPTTSQPGSSLASEDDDYDNSQALDGSRT